MKHYIGIDLGTTNSAICSYDGQEVRIWKSPDQNDVTPSAIYIDKRGNRYYGRRAYDNAPRSPQNSATLFKRFMGTNTKIEIKAANVTMTPEECSAEILKVLFGYLPEEIRNAEDTAVVITVPAAFNQMKKDATLEAARLAGFHHVALMQEPVAAIMSVMRQAKKEGIFLVYDLGGGTFDISIAENIGGKVNLLAHGGIEMCGGRDWDRGVFTSIVVPWLKEHFELPDDFLANRDYKTLVSLAHWASEKAKIELASMECSTIALSESEARCLDLNDEEIYLDIAVSREQLDDLIAPMIQETIQATRETMAKAGITSNDIDRVVFIGGPTNYKPLRDSVCFELALPSDTSINPMTAVAEGASIFAESIDWNSSSHARKNANEEKKASVDISLRYNARTTQSNSKLLFVIANSEKLNAEITSLDTGWSSGRIGIVDGTITDIPLTKNGENHFEIIIYDKYGMPIAIENNRITITKTIAAIGAIPASHSIGVEVLNNLDGSTSLDFLVKEGDDLPKRGKKVFRAGQTIKAGSASAYNFKLWEGNIETPIDDNRFIGLMKISGLDFEDGVVPVGAEIECDYEMADSGAIQITLSIPSIGSTFSNKNFYSRQEGQQDALDTDKIANEGQKMIDRIDEMSEQIADDRLRVARAKAEHAAFVTDSAYDTEAIQEASNALLEAKSLMARTRKDHLAEMRQMDLDGCVSLYNKVVRKHSKQSEQEAFDNQVQVAQRAINRNDPGFENLLSQLYGKCAVVLYRQDWFVIDRFNSLIEDPCNYTDNAKFADLKLRGLKCVQNDRIDELRDIIFELNSIKLREVSIEDTLEKSNILRG